MTCIEVALELDLGGHASGEPLAHARVLAVALNDAAEELATDVAEASGPPEAHGARPRVRYRAADGDWVDFWSDGAE